MFTGIVEEVGSVVSVPGASLTVSAIRVLEGLAPGGSIAVNGVCLTVTHFDEDSFTVDIMPETLRRTNLGGVRPGDRVNLERPLGLGGEVGGHLVQGHVDGTGRVISSRWEGEAKLVGIGAGPEITRYVVPKGFIAVDGISLTIVSRDSGSFGVSVVGYTREHTTLADRQVGDTVNLEVDIIAKYVEQLGGNRGGGITFEFLQEHGFAPK